MVVSLDLRNIRVEARQEGLKKKYMTDRKGVRRRMGEEFSNVRVPLCAAAAPLGGSSTFKDAAQTTSLTGGDLTTTDKLWYVMERPHHSDVTPWGITLSSFLNMTFKCNKNLPQNLSPPLKAKQGNFPFCCQLHSNSVLTTNHQGSGSLLYF